MKNFFKILPLCIFLFGCQGEEMVIEEPPAEQVIRGNSMLKDLVSKVALMDGSNDNILDQSGCTTVGLPVTVVVNGQQLMINSEDDFDAIEDIFDQSLEDEDSLVIVFPVTIILPDHSQVLISDQASLEDLLDECEPEDDDIECIDFQYPLSLSVYDAVTQIADVVVLESDEDFFNFFENAGDDDLIELDFPINLVLFNGETVQVNDNNELEDAIEEAADLCDEDDDNDGTEDDPSDPDDPVDPGDQAVMNAEDYLTDGVWRISTFSDGTDLTSEFADFTFDFDTDRVVIADSLATMTEGEWRIRASNSKDTLFVDLDFDVDDGPLLLLNDDWQIIMFSEILFETKSDSEIDGVDKLLTLEKN